MWQASAALPENEIFCLVYSIHCGLSSFILELSEASGDTCLEDLPAFRDMGVIFLSSSGQFFLCASDPPHSRHPMQEFAALRPCGGKTNFV